MSGGTRGEIWRAVYRVVRGADPDLFFPYLALLQRERDGAPETELETLRSVIADRLALAGEVAAADALRGERPAQHTA